MPKFVAPSGVVIELSEAAGNRIGFKPVKDQPPTETPRRGRPPKKTDK